VDYDIRRHAAVTPNCMCFLSEIVRV